MTAPDCVICGNVGALAANMDVSKIAKTMVKSVATGEVRCFDLHTCIHESRI